MKRSLTVGCLGLLAIANTDSAAVTAPSFKAGDTWVFDETHQRGTSGFLEQKVDLAIERTDTDTMLVGVKRDGAPTAYEDHVVGLDWSQRRLVEGIETSTTKPFNFPMKIGQTWTVDYTDPTRRGMQMSVHVHRTYRVMGWEDVTLPAGTFHTIKVEASGVDKAIFSLPNSVVGGAAALPTGSAAFTQSQHGGVVEKEIMTRAEFDYAPTVKNYVKSFEEQYSGDNILLSRDSRAMISFRPGV